MTGIPSHTQVFLDTNILLYAVTDHPRFGPWCNDFLDRIDGGHVKGHISVIVLNELIHKLMIGEVAQEKGLKPGKVVQYLKRHPETLHNLNSYEIVAEVEKGYALNILGVSAKVFAEARHLMQVHRLMSNDALHLAVMQSAGIRNLVTNDPDFDRVEGIRVWKPQSRSQADTVTPH